MKVIFDGVIKLCLYWICCCCGFSIQQLVFHHYLEETIKHLLYWIVSYYNILYDVNLYSNFWLKIHMFKGNYKYTDFRHFVGRHSAGLTALSVFSFSISSKDYALKPTTRLKWFHFLILKFRIFYLISLFITYLYCNILQTNLLEPFYFQ